MAVEPEQKGPTMPIVTHRVVPTHSGAPVGRKPRLTRLVHANAEGRTRMYLEAVTDPATGLVDPLREQQLLRIMAL